MTTLRDCLCVGRGERSGRGYTLIELLIVIVILGLAGALVIPSMSETGVLRVQAAVRTMVSDMTFAQSDALAFQSRRVIVFGRVARIDEGSGLIVTEPGNGYTVYAPPVGAATLDLNNDVMIDPGDPRRSRPFTRLFGVQEFGAAEVQDPAFNGGAQLIFDELGGPVRQLTGDDPGGTGTVDIVAPDGRFRVTVEAFTGRITVARTG